MATRSVTAVRISSAHGTKTSLWLGSCIALQSSWMRFVTCSVLRVTSSLVGKLELPYSHCLDNVSDSCFAWTNSNINNSVDHKKCAISITWLIFQTGDFLRPSRVSYIDAGRWVVRNIVLTSTTDSDFAPCSLLPWPFTIFSGVLDNLFLPWNKSQIQNNSTHSWIQFIKYLQYTFQLLIFLRDVFNGHLKGRNLVLQVIYRGLWSCQLLFQALHHQRQAFGYWSLRFL